MEKQDHYVKICQSCFKDKPVSGFHKKKSGKFGVSAICKDCTSVSDAKNYRRRSDEKKETSARWQSDNSRRVNDRVSSRRRNTPVEMTPEDWQLVMEKFNGVCLACGTDEGITKDHIIPVSKGGRDVVNNVQPLCRSCNSSKGTKIIDYRRSICLNES